MTLGDRVAVLRDGALEQVEQPLEVYRRPATRFVADFIGVPRINWFDGDLAHQAGRLRLRTADFAVDAPAALGADGERAVAIGVRPQDLRPAAVENGDLAGRVEVVEPLGSAVLVHARSKAGTPFRMLLPPDADVAVDAPIGARLDRDRLHLFDAQTGSRMD